MKSIEFSIKWPQFTSKKNSYVVSFDYKRTPCKYMMTPVNARVKVSHTQTRFLTWAVSDLITSFAALDFAASSVAIEMAFWSCWEDRWFSFSWFWSWRDKLSTWITQHSPLQIGTKFPSTWKEETQMKQCHDQEIATSSKATDNVFKLKNHMRCM